MASATAAYDEELSSRLLKHQIRLTVGLLKHSLVVNEDDDNEFPNSSFHHNNILLSPHFLVCTLSCLLSGTKKDARAQLARTLLCHRISDKFLRDNVNDFVAAHCDHCKSMLKKNKMSLRVDTYQYWDTSSARKPNHQKLWKKYHCLAKELPLMHEPKACLDTLTSINQDFLDSDGDTTVPMLSASNFYTLVADSIDTLLVSSVHFKSAWSKEFELFPYGEFRKSNGETIKTELLYNKKSFHYYQDRESMSRAIEIKFANHGTVSMVLILPDDNISLHHYVKHLLDYNVLKRILKNLTTRFEVQLTFPKFALKAKVNMVKPLQVVRSFVPKNNRDNESIQSIDKKVVLVQRLAIEVDEKGANSKQQQQLPGLMNKLKIKSNLSRKEVEFKADRPFLFLIVTNGEHRQILFAGLCNDPTQECV